MKFLLTIFLLLPVSVLASEEGATPSQSGQGPGVPLPQHSKPLTLDLSKLQSRAIALSERVREPATELFSLLALIALIWAGYQAQFRGLHEFVGTLLSIVITSSLILHYKEIVPFVFDARSQLQSALTENDFVFTKQLSAMMAGLSSSLALMSLSGIAAGVGLFLILLAAVLVYLIQLLFESVLITLGPLAIATLAFQHTRGIFTFWFKTWIAVILIPVGWTLGAKLIGETFVIQDPDLQSFLAAIVSILGYGAVFLGMPVITVMIVNAGGGVAAAGMPSALGMASSLLGGLPSFGRGSSGLSGSIASPSLQSAVTGVTTTLGNVAPTNASSRTSTDSFSQRAINAQQWHKQMKPVSKL